MDKKFLATMLRTIRIDQLLGHTLVVFCTFIPLFAFMEFRRGWVSTSLR